MNISSKYTDINELVNCRIIGGIAGINYGTIINCVNNGNITAATSPYTRSTNAYAGGICAQNESNIINCQNFGTIYSTVGFDPHYWNSIAGAYPACNSSGIAMNSNSGSIKNSINHGIVTAEITKIHSSNPSDKSGRSYGGGISSQDLNVTDCYYSSSANIDACHISTAGTMLNEAQLKNETLNLTQILNKNVAALNEFNLNYWANSIQYNNGKPFLINGFYISSGASEISSDKAILNFYPQNIISDAIQNKGFEYRMGDENNYRKIMCSGNAVSINGLKNNIQYYYRPFITLSNGKTILFTEHEFYTNNIFIETYEAENITPISATLRASFNLGSTQADVKGFLWKKVEESKYSTLITTNNNAEVDLTGLQPNTLYEYRAFAIDNTTGTSLYGNIITFSTSPILITLKDAHSTSNSIIITGEVNLPNYNGSISVLYRELSDFTYESQNIICNNGIFNCEITELRPKTQYEILLQFDYQSSLISSEKYNYETDQLIVNTYTPETGNVITFRGALSELPTNGYIGFEYRRTIDPDLIDSNIIVVNEITKDFSAVTTDVVNNEHYKVRAFYNSTNETVYGSWVYFTPTIVNASINDINMDTTKNLPVYNIDGIKVNNLQEGRLYIIGNKKIIYK